LTVVTQERAASLSYRCPLC